MTAQIPQVVENMCGRIRENSDAGTVSGYQNKADRKCEMKLFCGAGIFSILGAPTRQGDDFIFPTLAMQCCSN